MKLIGSLTSPYVRKVRVVLAEKKFEYEFTIDPPSRPGSSVAGHNPLARIPVLVLDDGSPLYDSRVIVEYIDHVTPNNKLLPTANRERTEAKRWEALADGLLDAAVAIMLERRRPAGEQSADWIRRQFEVIDRSLAALADGLADKSHCMGTPFTLADIATGCALGYLNFRFPDIAWASRHPNLERLLAKLEKRPSFADTMPRDA